MKKTRVYYKGSLSRPSTKLFLQSSEFGLPHPHSRRGVCRASPPFDPGGVYSLAGEGGWRSPNSDEETYTVVLFIYKYFVDRDLPNRVSV